MPFRGLSTANFASKITFQSHRATRVAFLGVRQLAAAFVLAAMWTIDQTQSGSKLPHSKEYAPLVTESFRLLRCGAVS
jgi:hypothetical protein